MEDEQVIFGMHKIQHIQNTRPLWVCLRIRYPKIPWFIIFPS
jgi:hypothetical protein